MVKVLDGNYKSLTLFSDLGKAFDTVSVPRLIVKLEELRMKGTLEVLLHEFIAVRLTGINLLTLGLY